MSQRAYSRRKAKGFLAESQQLLLHPLAFFQALPEQGESRTWLLAAALILALVAYSAVQQSAMLPSSDFGASSTNPVQAQVLVGLLAAARLIFAWLAQAVLLLPLAWLSKQTPRFALNLHSVIWSSLPFALLALIQVAYLWAGGPIGGAGIAPVLTSTLPYEMLNSNFGIFLLQVAQHFTLFGFWNLALLYLAGRHSLQAPTWAVLGFLLLWLLALVLVPSLLSILSSPSTGF